MKEDLATRFLDPRSVAYVGIPRKSGPRVLNPVDNLLAWGYRGRIQIVHPHVSEIAGLYTVGSVAELDGEVDLGVIATPRELTPSMVEACAAKGIRALVVVNQGFADADSVGRELQRAMIEAAHAGGARILGPNTIGTCNAFDRFTSSFMPLEREEYPLGMICQSGIYLVGARSFTGGAGLGVDLGNACDVGVAEALSWLGRDLRLRVLAVHAEGIPEGRRFVEVAREISRRMPVLVLKTGRSAEGARAAVSHTGSLTGEDRVVDAALREAGVLRVDDTEDLLDLSRGFLRLPPMRGRRVAVVTFTGGGAISALDAMETWGLETASLQAATMEGLREYSPPWMLLGNPMDVFPALLKHGVQKAYGSALRDAVRDPKVDGVLCIVIGFRAGEVAHLDTAKLIAEISKDSPKPIVTWFYGPGVEEAQARLEQDGRAMAVPSPERGARLLARMAAYERWKNTRAG